MPDPEVGDTDNAAFEVDAVHVDGVQPAGVAETFTTCDPPPEAKFAVDGVIPNAHAAFVDVG